MNFEILFEGHERGISREIELALDERAIRSICEVGGRLSQLLYPSMVEVEIAAFEGSAISGTVHTVQLPLPSSPGQTPNMCELYVAQAMEQIAQLGRPPEFYEEGWTISRLSAYRIRDARIVLPNGASDNLNWDSGVSSKNILDQGNSPGTTGPMHNGLNTQWVQVPEGNPGFWSVIRTSSKHVRIEFAPAHTFTSGVDPREAATQIREVPLSKWTVVNQKFMDGCLV